jgi:hypothetical protein
VATYFTRSEKALRVSATPTVVAGRLQGTAAVTIADLDNPGATRPTPADYELFGPGDVVRLADHTIVRRFPAPGSSDAEETKLPLVEFDAVDLPWRYTPQAATGAVLRPWLVLVVGRRGPDEIVARPDGRVGLGLVTQAAHVLAESWRWAHVHEVDGRQIARLLAPVDLQPATEYVACVVPAFAPDGTDAWTGAAPVVSDCYDHWSFRTGPEGDFPDLAKQLHKADLAAISARSGRPFGRAQVRYVPRQPGSPTPVVLEAAGALRLPHGAADPPDPSDGPPPPAVAGEVTALTDRIVTPDGRGVVTAPRYDAGFATVADSVASPPGGWIDELRSDPRARGAAGLGAWNAIQWQDRIAAAAVAKAGELAAAHDRIRHVALGVEASRSMWRRRVPKLPADPGADPAATQAAAGDLVATLAPVLARLPADTGGTVLDAIAGRTPSLGRALFSSAARRVLRSGPARTARIAGGAAGLGAVIGAANVCPGRKDDPADVPDDRQPDPGRVERAVKALILAATGNDDALTSRIMDRVLPGGTLSSSQLAGALLALTPGKDGRPDPKALEEFLAGRDEPPVKDTIRGWGGWVDEVAAREPCAPIDLVGLAQAVSAAVDPTVALPPAARRVLSTLPGFTHIGPVEVEPELDLPLWSFLSQSSPDWMLPGVGDLDEGAVVALATNRPFVHALLTGANTQTAGELRWRNIKVMSRWSPLRRFWQRADHQVDVVPIREWAANDSLGSAAFAPDGRSSDAVVAFRTPLFKRYPATVVYLYKAQGDFDAPPENAPLAAPDRVDPTFTGTIGDDVTFFGFPVDPEALTGYWVVLEEPPAGYRFYSAAQVPPRVPAPGGGADPDYDSSEYAYRRFALPVRVLIGPLLDGAPA